MSNRKRREKSKSKATYSILTPFPPLEEMYRVTLSCTQLSAAFLEEFKDLSIELGIPTVTAILEPESASRTSGSASKSFTLVMLFAFNSSTTFGGGSGCDALVPQFTPTAAASELVEETVDRRMSNEISISVTVSSVFSLRRRRGKMKKSEMV